MRAGCILWGLMHPQAATCFQLPSHEADNSSSRAWNLEGPCWGLRGHSPWEETHDPAPSPLPTSDTGHSATLDPLLQIHIDRQGRCRLSAPTSVKWGTVGQVLRRQNNPQPSTQQCPSHVSPGTLQTQATQTPCTPTFKAALFTIPKRWKSSKCPWVDEGISNVVCPHCITLFSHKMKC